MTTLKKISFYILLIVWPFFASCFFKDKYLFEDIFVYLPFFLVFLFLFISIKDFILCEKRKKCEQTLSLKTGIIATLVLMLIVLLSLSFSFDLSSKFYLFNSLNFIFGFIIYNPFLIFYIYYLVISRNIKI